LWKTAIQAIESQPIFGVGTIGWKQLVDNNVKLGKLTATIGDYGFANSHAHNQFLDSYMRLGIIGLAISLFFITYPTFTFKNNNNLCVKLYLPIFLLICGLSDVPLFHTGLIYMVALYPFIILSDEERI
ncbi:MAG: O-antigen ligase family protein, partial [Shewanella sp.]